jgi:hypothetical protein
MSRPSQPTPALASVDDSGIITTRPPMRGRVTVFLLLNVVVFLALIAGGASSGADVGLAIYVILLFALCTSPILLLDGLNGRYALLGIFTGMYFVFFGALDLLSLVFGATPLPRTVDFMTSAEAGILTGAICALLGYVGAVNLAWRNRSRQPVADFPKGTLLAVGLALWLIGSACWVYFNVFVLKEKTNIATTRGLASLGAGMTFVILLGNLMQPLGVLLLAYGYARFRSILWFTLILTVVLVQVVMGFVSDIKSTAMLAGILVILAKTLVDNRLPKAWIVCGGLFLAAAFPVFQAYRAEVTGERGLDRTQAIQEFGKVIEIALQSRDKVANARGEDRSQSFFERASLKANVELAFDHTGVDTPFQNGRTLLDLPFAFIPRIIWPDKPGVPAGQLFNRSFVKGGEPDTYISPSHFGELYWNFGWAGVLIGMTAIGAALGTIAAKCNLADRISLTRMLVLIATIKALCIDFEGSIAVAYVVWFRSLAAIGLLHLLFARRATAASSRILADLESPTPNRPPNLTPDRATFRGTELAPDRAPTGASNHTPPVAAPPVTNAAEDRRTSSKAVVTVQLPGSLASRFPNLMR